MRNTRRLTTKPADSRDIPTDRLFRISPQVYRGLVAHGLLTGHDKVTLQDGLLVHESFEGSTTLADRLYRLPLHVYHGIANLGLLDARDKVVLLDGLLVEKMTKGQPHIVATHLLMNVLADLIPPGWVVLKEDPMALPTGPTGRASEPEPDLTVLRGTIRDYVARKPGPEDVALVIEVAKRSLRDDRAGLARYAWAEIPAAWLINLIDRTVEVHSRPSGPSHPAHFQETLVYEEEDEVPVVIDGREIGRVVVRDILP
ncbi:MAG: hypothetical protein NVSMB9_25540 [Isosphaeraceae bacterium]